MIGCRHSSAAGISWSVWRALCRKVRKRWGGSMRREQVDEQEVDSIPVGYLICGGLVGTSPSQRTTGVLFHAMVVYQWA